MDARERPIVRKNLNKGVKKVKKIGILVLVVILALGAMGVGIAQWQEDLDINTTVECGELNVDFIAYSASGDGESFTFSPTSPPGAGTNSVALTVAKAYPGEIVVEYTVKNVGTIPAKVASSVSVTSGMGGEISFVENTAVTATLALLGEATGKVTITVEDGATQGKTYTDVVTIAVTATSI